MNNNQSIVKSLLKSTLVQYFIIFIMTFTIHHFLSLPFQNKIICSTIFSTGDKLQTRIMQDYVHRVRLKMANKNNTQFAGGKKALEYKCIYRPKCIDLARISNYGYMSEVSLQSVELKR